MLASGHAHGKQMTEIERFNQYVMPEPLSGCWLWTACEDEKGYGQFTKDGRKQCGAHRFSYIYYRGEIPPGMTLDHLCRVRCCVNPDHLEVVTRGENVLRGIGITAQNAKKTHCNKGHQFDEKNTYLFQGKRLCKRCRYFWRLKYPKYSADWIAKKSKGNE